ncbi:unnamed protein product (mitochondrion) [Plasmodiophora brassicae]|uniref:Uncharacterized protein n=1 Tax=Plasmodiophora brassicae TaxID=37360 RepID=A0A3P3Y7R8_PLABS|nr:unnamed protein product [Plasmodiophora brassicae]
MTRARTRLFKQVCCCCRCCSCFLCHARLSNDCVTVSSLFPCLPTATRSDRCARPFFQTMLVFAVAVIAVLLPPSLSQTTNSLDGHEAVALLLDAGANVNAVDYTGATALSVAAGQGLYDVVDLLVQAGANVSLGNANKATPLHAAARVGNARIVSLLIGKGADVNAVDSNGNTVLMSGAQSNSTQTVALLVAAGASVSSVNKNGWSALQVAMAASRPQIAAYLLSRNAPATLHDLCAIGNATAVRIAVQNGADVNAPATMSLSFLYTEGDSPVYVAASNGFADVIDVLARHGANVNQTNALGSSPVLAAVDRHSLAATMALIRAGANVNAVHAGVPLIEATWWA